jgi:formylglycine-generating enzyme required for sulfatase activity
MITKAVFAFLVSVMCCLGAWASDGLRFTNSIGMVFVPVPRTGVLFSIWETRIQDYEEFTKDGNAWERATLKKPTFSQGPEHPVVNVTWEDTKSFCKWLTERDRRAGLIKSTESYRLPTDLEWSAAVGLPEEKGDTPEKRSSVASGMPWGNGKPFKDCGNYAKLLQVDDFDCTSPVASFKPNNLGIYDLGGNVWEWCLDTADDGVRHVLRGASWSVGIVGSVGNKKEVRPHWRMASSFRDYTLPDGEIGDHGFRCVLDRGN